MSQSFIRVRTKAEIDKLIDEVAKNKKTLTNAVTDMVVGTEFGKTEDKKRESPIVSGLNKIVEKIDERLAPPDLNPNGTVKLDPRDNSVIRIPIVSTIVNAIANNTNLVLQRLYDANTNEGLVQLMQRIIPIAENTNTSVGQVALALMALRTATGEDSKKLLDELSKGKNSVLN